MALLRLLLKFNGALWRLLPAARRTPSYYYVWPGAMCICSRKSLRGITYRIAKAADAAVLVPTASACTAQLQTRCPMPIRGYYAGVSTQCHCHSRMTNSSVI